MVSDPRGKLLSKSKNTRRGTGVMAANKNDKITRVAKMNEHPRTCTEANEKLGKPIEHQRGNSERT